MNPSLSFQIDPPARRVVIHYGEHPTAEEWIATMHAILADPTYRERMDFLFDKRAVPAPPLAYADRVVEFYRMHRQRMGRCAIVVSGPFSFGMARMEALMCGPGDIVRAFTDLAEAEQWLALARGAGQAAGGQ